jgi:hypothetical protein
VQMKNSHILPKKREAQSQVLLLFLFFVDPNQLPCCSIK